MKKVTRLTLTKRVYGSYKTADNNIEAVKKLLKRSNAYNFCTVLSGSLNKSQHIENLFYVEVSLQLSDGNGGATLSHVDIQEVNAHASMFGYLLYVTDNYDVTIQV